IIKAASSSQYQAITRAQTVAGGKYAGHWQWVHHNHGSISTLASVGIGYRYPEGTGGVGSYCLGQLTGRPQVRAPYTGIQCGSLAFTNALVRYVWCWTYVGNYHRIAAKAAKSGLCYQYISTAAGNHQGIVSRTTGPLVREI